VLEEKSGAAN